jgi:hypothetical protein
VGRCAGASRPSQVSHAIAPATSKGLRDESRVLEARAFSTENEGRYASMIVVLAVVTGVKHEQKLEACLARADAECTP